MIFSAEVIEKILRGSFRKQYCASHRAKLFAKVVPIVGQLTNRHSNKYSIGGALRLDQ